MLARVGGEGCVGAGGGGGSSRFSSSADNDHAGGSADNDGTVGNAGSSTEFVGLPLPPPDSELLIAAVELEAGLLMRAVRPPPTRAVTCCR